jgi:hypothetical protein
MLLTGTTFALLVIGIMIHVKRRLRPPFLRVPLVVVCIARELLYLLVMYMKLYRDRIPQYYVRARNHSPPIFVLPVGPVFRAYGGGKPLRFVQYLY